MFVVVFLDFDMGRIPNTNGGGGLALDVIGDILFGGMNAHI